MLQDDSNGESSFEIIDKRTHQNTEKSESSDTLSAVSSSTVSMSSGNLLSNVSPPSGLPDFTLWPNTIGIEPQPSITVSTQPQVQSKSRIDSASVQPQPTISTAIPTLNNQFPVTQFSAAIPPSKGLQHGPITQPKQVAEEGSSGFIGLVKEAFSSGGVLSKMAEKAKSSVDSIITTLDPQMSEYINSDGDTEVTVTSENEEEVSAIREAFHSVFGKAWVNGIRLNLQPKIAQTIGFEAGVKNAEEKIEYALKFRNTPTIGIENILFQQMDGWFDLSILVLKDTEKQVTVKTFSQATPIPVDQFLRNIENERPDCVSLNTQDKLALYLQSIPEWQAEISGVSRKEVLLLAAKTLVRIYKKRLASK